MLSILVSVFLLVDVSNFRQKPNPISHCKHSDSFSVPTGTHGVFLWLLQPEKNIAVVFAALFCVLCGILWIHSQLPVYKPKVSAVHNGSAMNPPFMKIIMSSFCWKCCRVLYAVSDVLLLKEILGWTKFKALYNLHLIYTHCNMCVNIRDRKSNLWFSIFIPATYHPNT